MGSFGAPTPPKRHFREVSKNVSKRSPKKTRNSARNGYQKRVGCLLCRGIFCTHLCLGASKMSKTIFGTIVDCFLAHGIPIIPWDPYYPYSALFPIWPYLATRSFLTPDLRWLLCFGGGWARPGLFFFVCSLANIVKLGMHLDCAFAHPPLCEAIQQQRGGLVVLLASAFCSSSLSLCGCEWVRGAL